MSLSVNCYYLQEVDNIRQELLEKLKRKWILIDEKYGMHERLISAKRWAKENPTVTLILISTFVICSLPLFCFLISLTGIFFILLTGFIMFEGRISTDFGEFIWLILKERLSHWRFWLSGVCFSSVLFWHSAYRRFSYWYMSCWNTVNFVDGFVWLSNGAVISW